VNQHGPSNPTQTTRTLTTAAPRDLLLHSPSNAQRSQLPSSSPMWSRSRRSQSRSRTRRRLPPPRRRNKPRKTWWSRLRGHQQRLRTSPTRARCSPRDDERRSVRNGPSRNNNNSQTLIRPATTSPGSPTRRPTAAAPSSLPRSGEPLANASSSSSQRAILRFHSRLLRGLHRRS
jgi:hypothetical protein